MPARAYACLRSDHGVPLRCWSDTQRSRVRTGKRPRGAYGGQGKAARFSVADGFAASLQMTTRRFPPPWTVEELDACFILRDHGGQQLAYVRFENEPGRRSAAKLLSEDAR